jgi:inhibitor of KinA
MNRRAPIRAKNGRLETAFMREPLYCDIGLLKPVISIFPLGDSAVTLDLGHLMDEGLNRRALVLGNWLKAHPFPGLRDVLVSYCSVSIFFDPDLIRPGLSAGETIFEYARKILDSALAEADCIDHAGAGLPREAEVILPPPIRVPVCYADRFGGDLAETARIKGLSPEELIEIHCNTIYRVYMVGFLPGFPYMGKTDERIQIPRKERPVPVAAGGVGIAGNQTGIYPLDSPGGWQIIGRTPHRMFDPLQDPPVILKAGDRVQFFSISPAEFERFVEKV